MSFTLLLTVVALRAQETWSLEQCIRYARQNSLSVRQAQNTIQLNQLTLKQNQYNRIPTLNASVSYGYNFGRTIDPTTNSFINQENGSSQLQVSSGVTLFGGNQINNSIKQSKIDVQASELNAASTANDLGLNVATAYLNILLGEEQLATARQQLALSQTQLEQTNRLIQAGSRPEVDRYDILAQIARNEQSIIQAENTIANAYLNLKQLMNVDQNLDIRIQRPEVNVPALDPDQFSLNEIYTTALGSQPQIRANDLNIESAQMGVAVARGALLPTVSLFGNLSSFYSTQNKRVTGYNDIRNPETVFINGQPVVVEFPGQIPLFDNNPYFDQINQNFGQGIGVSLNIPILNNFRSRLGVERAQVTVLNAEVTSQQTRQQLKTNIQSAIANARAAKRSYEAAQRSVEANQIAFQNAQRRFDLGAVNSLEYTTARNNLDQAQISLIQAKYQYVFNVKQVEFYLGQELKLD
ncbi:MAG: TolC family protein [Saprospiraceae bacterium]